MNPISRLQRWNQFNGRFPGAMPQAAAFRAFGAVGQNNGRFCSVSVLFGAVAGVQRANP
jgi:hypothetical protein